MGHGIRPDGIGGSIRTWWPDDTDSTMYIVADPAPTLEELMDKINDRWPGASLSNIAISCEKIHTDCLGFKLCNDPSDYTDFLIIVRIPGA